MVFILWADCEFGYGLLSRIPLVIVRGGLLGEMRHWVDCRVASTVVEWMIEGLDSCEWVDQGGGVFC